MNYNANAFEIFKACLLATIGMKFNIKEDFQGDEWKKKEDG